jgi:ATP-binding cassette subfamily B protein
VFKLAVYLKKYRKETILGPFFKFLEAVFELLLPTVMALIINNGVNQQDSGYVLRMGLLMGVMSLGGFLCALICQHLAARASQGFGTDLRNAMYQHLSAFSYTQIDQFGTATLTTRMTNDINQLQIWVAMMIRLLVRAPLICIGAIIMAVILNPQLALILIAATPIFGVIIYVMTVKTAPLYRQYQKQLDGVGRVLRESIGGVRVVRAFAKTGEEQGRFNNANDQLMFTGFAISRLSALFNPLTSLVVYIAIILILWQGAHNVEGGTLLQGEIVAFISYVNQILYALLVISNLIVLLIKSIASAERVNEVLDVVPAGNTSLKTLPAVASPDVPIVRFEHVSFGYNETGWNVLDDVTLDIWRGETIGIIGGTGAGKSTFINLIPRFYDATAGTVYVDGVDVKQQDIHALRRKIGLVPQQTLLFSGTVAENIRWGKDNASDAEVRTAAEIAQAEEFIQQLPKGYDTFIQRGGTNLSGGQKQRLTMARALIAKPDMLILDDATSALDYATDARLRRALKQWEHRLTLLMVSQRIGAIRHADRIFVFDEGKIVGIGTHQQLLQTCEVYRQIALSQLSEEEMQR